MEMIHTFGKVITHDIINGAEDANLKIRPFAEIFLSTDRINERYQILTVLWKTQCKEFSESESRRSIENERSGSAIL
jgi:hypothetical protein